MEKFQVEWYNHWGQCNSRFYVFAKDEEDAKRLFLMTFRENNRDTADASIDGIFEYMEPDFMTEEDCIKQGERNKKGR